MAKAAARVARSAIGPVGIPVLLLLLGGCVDMFTADPSVATARWTGTSTAGAAEYAECAPMTLDVAIWDDPLFLPQQIGGRASLQPAEPRTLRTRAAEAASTWWVEGYMNPDYVVQLETRRQRPVYFRSKPYAVWRGNLVQDGRIELVESGSPCGRQLVLTKS